MRFRPERIQPPERKNVLFVAQVIEEQLVELLKKYQGNDEVEIISPWRLERHIVSYALWAEKTKNPVMFSADQAWAFFESLYRDLNRAINRNELALTIEVSGTSFTEIDLCLRWLESGFCCQLSYMLVKKPR